MSGSAVTFGRQPAAGGHHGGGDEEEGRQRLAEQQERQGGADEGGQGVEGAGAGGVIERLSCGWGWRYVWHLDTDPRNEFHFECTECLYRRILEKRGVLERFGPMFCHADIINYGSLPYTDFIRTQTLCQGGDRCDFRFVRHRKGEQWQRSRSLFKMGDND